jgi:O-methyltransferase involved in polyketide biosynthesis
MPETTNQNLSGLSETYLAPLYWKAMETQRPDAMIKDEKAVALVTQGRMDFSRVKQIHMNELLIAMRIILPVKWTATRANSLNVIQTRW